MHSPSSSSSSRPVAWLVQVLLLCVLGLSSSTRGVFGDDAWSYTATFSLSGSEGTLEGAPTITSNPTPNYAQTVSLPATAANQNVTITFVLPRQSPRNEHISSIFHQKMNHPCHSFLLFGLIVVSCLFLLYLSAQWTSS
jgi:hypothetical protein